MSHGVSMLLVGMALVLGLGVAHDVKAAPASKSSTSAASRRAANELIVAHLRSPASAKVALRELEVRPEYVYTTYATVDAQNAYGAMIGDQWCAAFKLDGPSANAGYRGTAQSVRDIPFFDSYGSAERACLVWGQQVAKQEFELDIDLPDSKLLALPGGPISAIAREFLPKPAEQRTCAAGVFICGGKCENTPQGTFARAMEAHNTGKSVQQVYYECFDKCLKMNAKQSAAACLSELPDGAKP